MHINREANRLIRSMCSMAAVTIFAAAAVIGVQAQSPAVASAATPVYPALKLSASLAAPLDLSAATSSLSSSSSSSSSSNLDAADPGVASVGSDASQPPPRRTYGRPTYSDSHTNADGSAKWTFAVGGGFNLPVSTTHDDLTTGYRFQVGGGRNLNKKFGVLLQYDYDRFGFQNSTLNRQLSIYNNQYIDAGLTQLGGHTHMWSFTLNPVYTIAQGEKFGGYLVAGVGFYHKVADFTTPGTGVYCDYYGFCYQYQADQIIDSYVSNAPGFNGGGGMTYKLSRWGSALLYVEGRYVFVDNSARSYAGTMPSNSPPGSTTFNAFPQNGNHTTLIPVTFGIRF